jgi:hypothetical protein
MMLEYPIIADEKSMTIKVGHVVFDRPVLSRLPEWETTIKNDICGPAPWELGPKAAHKFYANRLGCKFNRRFQAANYWLWIGNRMTVKAANVLRHDGRHFRRYHEGLVWRANQAIRYINEAERDGLFHLIPAIVIFGASPQSIRRTVGQGAWRKIAANSLTRNRLIMHAVAKMSDIEPHLFARLLEFPSGVMRAVYGATEDERAALHVTTKLRPVEFQRAVHIVRDTRDMVGERFNPAWSRDRMIREHNEAMRAVMAGKFSAKQFASPWSFEGDGFSASLLTSQLDIASEGAEQHHCVASYASRAARGKYAVFRIEGRERATAGLIPRVAVGQIYGACNQPVSQECREFSYRLADEYAVYLQQEARAA